MNQIKCFDCGKALSANDGDVFCIKGFDGNDIYFCNKAEYVKTVSIQRAAARKSVAAAYTRILSADVSDRMNCIEEIAHEYTWVKLWRFINANESTLKSIIRLEKFKCDTDSLTYLNYIIKKQMDNGAKNLTEFCFASNRPKSRSKRKSMSEIEGD